MDGQKLDGFDEKRKKHSIVGNWKGNIGRVAYWTDSKLNENLMELKYLLYGLLDG